MENEKIVGFLRNISELVVAVLVSETKSELKVKKPAFLGINGQNNQVNINFIPMELLSINPTVNVRNLLKDPTEDLVFTFDKKALLKSGLELSDSVIENYKTLITAPPSSEPEISENSEENIVKLF